MYLGLLVSPKMSGHNPNLLIDPVYINVNTT